MSGPPEVEENQRRSPAVRETPYVEPSSLPRTLFPKASATSPSTGGGRNDLLHPAFLPPCEHGREGDMHAHAFDLLSLSSGCQSPSQPLLIPPAPTEIIPASVPTHPTSVLSTSRPSIPSNGNLAMGNVAGSAPKPRRMSSSTTGVLGRGKLGLMGEANGTVGNAGKDTRTIPANHTTAFSGASMPSRRPPVPSGTSPAPPLFDFAKTDRRPSHSGGRPQLYPSNGRTVSASVVPASLPTRGGLLAQARQIHPPPHNDMELDMEFDGDEEEEEEGGSGSGSAELDMDMDEVDELDGTAKDAWRKLALGTGSGGVKGRRKGMVFKCEHCSKEYRHPSCLVKHRWEHSPHWKEPTELSMSKHQQVQMLEAAAILAHLHPTAGRALPNDKSLWPAMLSPPAGEHAQLRRLSHGQASVRSPPSSITAPLTPSSPQDPAILGAQQKVKDRKSSPGSDSTTSSVGEPYVPQPPSVSPGSNTLGIRQNGHHIRAVGMEKNRVTSSVSSTGLSPGTPHSLGFLPDMSGLHFHTGSMPSGVSPIPNRGMPMSLKARAGMIGGGMFGAMNTSIRSSSMRSGADDDDDILPNGTSGGGLGGRGKTSSEEAEERRKGREGEDWGMAMEMEL